MHLKDGRYYEMPTGMVVQAFRSFWLGNRMALYEDADGAPRNPLYVEEDGQLYYVEVRARRLVMAQPAGIRADDLRLL